MTTGAKVALGCGIAALIGIVLCVVIVGGGIFWAKGKIDQVAGEQKEIEALRTKANRNSFDRPADGLIREDRLVTFLNVRKRVYDVYKTHEAELEAMSKKQKGDLGDIRTTFSVVNEVRRAQAQALADLGMSESEYRFMVEQIYKTLFAASVAASTGGKSVSQAASEAYSQAAEAMAKAGADAEKARRQAKAAGDQAAEQASEKSGEAVREGTEELKKQSEQMADRARDLDVPPANLALFRKYEADIKKYSMGGLEWIGL